MLVIITLCVFPYDDPLSLQIYLPGLYAAWITTPPLPSSSGPESSWRCRLCPLRGSHSLSFHQPFQSSAEVLAVTWRNNRSRRWACATNKRNGRVKNKLEAEASRTNSGRVAKRCPSQIGKGSTFHSSTMLNP